RCARSTATKRTSRSRPCSPSSAATAGARAARSSRGGARKRARHSPAASRCTSRWKRSCGSCSATRSTKSSPSTSTPGSRAARNRCRTRPRSPSRSDGRGSGGPERMTELGALVDDLGAEQETLVALVRDIAPEDWLRPTPAWSWDVRDTVAHLAHVDELAMDTATDGPMSLSQLSSISASSEDVTYAGVLRGRRMSGREVLAWWERTAAAERDLLRSLDPRQRVPWGIGMSPPALTTARLMETWAHGIDVFAALGVDPLDTDRLAHVAWLATRALP